MAEQLATAAELRTYLDIPAADTTALPTARAELLLEGVSTAICHYCHREEFTTAEVTTRIDGSGGPHLLLPGAPVTVVTAVLEDPDGAAVDVLTAVDWSADGILTTRTGRFALRRRFYEVTFTAGYASIPADVKATALRLAARAVSNPEGLATEGIGGYNAGYAFDETRLPVLSAPDRRALSDYRLR